MRTFKPAAAAYAARCKTDFIRNIRREGLIPGLGTTKGGLSASSDTGGMVFLTAEEVVLLRSGVFLGPYLKTYKNAFEFVMERRAVIEDAARDAVFDPADLSNDYVLTLTLDDSLSTGYSGATSSPVAKITFDPESSPPAGLLQVNFSELARQVARDLKAYVSGEDPA